jgi:hypothetical protein
LEFHLTSDTALIEKREELKRRLAAGEYKTLVDVLFDGLSKIIQKITRSPRPISPWFTSMILYLLMLLLAFAGPFLTGDVPILMRQISAFPPGAVPLLALVGYFGFVIMVAGNFYVHRVFETCKESVLNTAESITTLNDFEYWLRAVCNRKFHLVVSIIGGALIGIYVLYIYNLTFGLFFPISTATAFLFYYMVISAFLYLLFYMAVLSVRVGRYHLKLYTADPGGSEVISRLASLFSNLVYLVAIYAAFFILAAAFSKLLITQFMVLLILLLWIPLATVFVFYQSSLSSIMRRSKSKTLNEIQARIEKLHASEQLGEKDTMETINRLMDYYDRIKNTRSSKIDLGAVLNLVNSLLLPLLALVLANLDKILNLFR